MTIAELADRAAQRHLAIRAVLHPGPEDGAPQDCKTIVLLGPDEPGFWPAFTQSAEYRDAAPDPMDRWSKRQINDLAQQCGGAAAYPSDGPPYPPFIRWALNSGDIWQAPVGLLVHAEAGLFVSFRGALVLPERLASPVQTTNPCLDCAAPCLTACPAGAMTDAGYDIPRCKAHTLSEAGAACRSGCLVRRACPVSQAFGRAPEQSQFHMAAFLGISGQRGRAGDTA